MTPEVCPNCGALVPPKARACPQCGSDETTGWSESARSGGLDLPGENFDYDDFVENEFGGARPARPRGIKPFWWAAAVLTTLAMLWVFARWLFW